MPAAAAAAAEAVGLEGAVLVLVLVAAGGKVNAVTALDLLRAAELGVCELLPAAEFADGEAAALDAALDWRESRAARAAYGESLPPAAFISAILEPLEEESLSSLS